MQCLQCDKKLRWLKKPIDGAYCSALCRDTALDQAEARKRDEAFQVEAALEAHEAEERALERERLEVEAAMLRGVSEVVRKPNLSDTPCPKCSAAWTVMQGGGALGRSLGHCGSCGFHAQFISVESCTNCRCLSLVVESQDDARCPRCKSRPRRRRQIA